MASRVPPSDDEFAYGMRVPNVAPGHAEGCMLQKILRFGDEQDFALCSCVENCPSLMRAVARGRELAERYGW